MLKMLFVSIAINLCVSTPLLYAAKLPFSSREISRVKTEMKPLDLSIERTYPASTQKYFDFYGINYQNFKHYFGSYTSDKYKIASHIVLPKNPKGTIIILHGYFDHTGEIKTLIDLCLKLNYGVATIDLPGHGLSDGEPGVIDDFNEYASTLDNFLVNYQTFLPKPFHLIGHSTGCAAAYEYLSSKKATPLNKIIFLAPLVRSSFWTPSSIAFFIVEPFVKKIPRKFTTNSGNKQYLEFVKNDPLEGKYISTRWFNALYTWNKKIADYTPISTPALIIQGDSDNTVAWKYNVKFFEKKFNTIDVKIIKKGRHQLPNESPEISEKVFQYIDDFLSRQNEQ